MLVSNLLPS